MPDTTALDMEQMRRSASEATAVLRVLAHEDRLLLLCQLSQTELTVGELEQQLDIRQPSLSQHLGVLRREGLVHTRREGKYIHYRIADQRALAVLQTLYEHYCANQPGNDGEPS